MEKDPLVDVAGDYVVFDRVEGTSEEPHAGTTDPTPGVPLPSSAVPAAFVPILLPWTRLPSLKMVDPKPPMSMPSLLLPEITLPGGPVPPIVLFDAPSSITTPVPLPDRRPFR